MMVETQVKQELMTQVEDVAPGLTIPEDLPYSQWLWMGRKLVTQKNHIDWMIGDWVAFGREHFPEQIALALPDVIDDGMKLRRIERTAKAFPPHLRHEGLSFDHHAHVADLPVQEALPLLKQAGDQRLSPRQFRLVAMDFKVDTGKVLPREEDAEDDAILALVRTWNRATRTARAEFAEMVAASHLGLIEFGALPHDD